LDFEWDFVCCMVMVISETINITTILFLCLKMHKTYEPVISQISLHQSLAIGLTADPLDAKQRLFTTASETIGTVHEFKVMTLIPVLPLKHKHCNA